MIKQNLLNLAEEVEFVKTRTAQEKKPSACASLETKSHVQAQQNFRHKYGRKPPTSSTIQSRHKEFMETGNVLKRELAHPEH